MSLSFHGRWSEDQSHLHIYMLEIMAICFALIKALKYSHHFCVMISTDNTGGTHSPNLCLEVWKILQWCLKSYCHQDLSYPKQIQCFGRQVIENQQNSQNRVGIGSVDSQFNFPNVLLSQSGSGPSCSKLTTSLVNDSLKFTSSDTQICWNFLLKKCE